MWAAGVVDAQPAATAASAATPSAVPTAATAPACPRPGAAVVERFISADCPDCWSASDVAAATSGWLFDWIAHTPTGPQAALASAACTDAEEREVRAGGPLSTGMKALPVRKKL